MFSWVHETSNTRQGQHTIGFSFVMYTWKFKAMPVITLQQDLTLNNNTTSSYDTSSSYLYKSKLPQESTLV